MFAITNKTKNLKTVLTLLRTFIMKESIAEPHNDTTDIDNAKVKVWVYLLGYNIL